MWNVQFQDAQEKVGAKERVGHRISDNMMHGKSMEKKVLRDHGGQITSYTS